MMICCCSSESLLDILCEYDEEERTEVIDCYIKKTDPVIIAFSENFLRCLLNKQKSLFTLIGLACDKTFSSADRNWCFHDVKYFLEPYTTAIAEKDEAAIKACFT